MSLPREVQPVTCKPAFYLKYLQLENNLSLLRTMYINLHIQIKPIQTTAILLQIGVRLK